MPITPLHMGPGMLLKGVAERQMSLIAFGVAQIVMDLEPLLGLLRGAAELHGISHTLLLALPIGALAAWLGRVLSPPLLGRWNQEMRHYGWLRLLVEYAPGWRPYLLGGWLGSYSHLLLDSLMHGDLHPSGPFGRETPCWGCARLPPCTPFASSRAGWVYCSGLPAVLPAVDEGVSRADNSASESITRQAPLKS